jgi:hypothetical protein
MAARTIVTSHPDVACDVCGRRLLRGEQADVFLSGGQRRTVCELCTPRATHEGWRRETETHGAGPRGQRPQRGRSLLGRLRRPSSDRTARPVRAERADSEPGEQPYTGGETPLDEEWAGIGEEWAGAGSEPAQADPAEPELASEALAEPAETYTPGATGADVARALEIFNAGEYPRRVAGVARSLGPACVKAAPLAGSQATVAIVVAWELCWYRYEIDLHDEAAGVRLAADGMELAELPAEDRVANATADERGELTLL